MSGSSNTSTTTQNSQPWSAAQPYLQDIMSQAQGLYNKGSSYFPGSTVAPFSPETEAGLQLTADRALNGSPTINAANGSLTNLLSGNGTAGLQQAANGAYLNSNPYLDQMFGAASKPVIDAVNAQFSLGGRTGSSANQHVLTQDLGNLAANIYGNNYANERQLQQNAQTTLGQQGLQASGLAPTIAGQDYTDLQNLLSVGTARDTQSQNQLNDLINRFNFGQTQPWQLLSNYGGAVSGLGSLGGTTTGTVKQPSTLLPSLVGGGASILSSGLGSGGWLSSLLNGVG